MYNMNTYKKVENKKVSITLRFFLIPLLQYSSLENPMDGGAW